MAVTDRSGRPISGVVPVAVSARVVETDDPERLGRVRVSWTTLPGEPVSPWVRVVMPGGGGGLYALPEPGDEVLVVFLQGCHEAGVVVGTLWNGSRPPPTEADDGMPTPEDARVRGARRSRDAFRAGAPDDGGNDRRLWRSRSGHLLAFDDTPGGESVHLWDATRTMCLVLDVAEQRVVLSNRGLDLHVRTGRDLYLEAGRDVVAHAGRDLGLSSGADVALEAGAGLDASSRGDARLAAGRDLSLTARGDVRVKATANLRVEGVLATLKGASTATVQGGTLAEVKAGLVKIN